MENKDPFFGVISDSTSETDFQLVAGSIDLPQARHTFFDNQIQYYQPDVSPVSCTVHAAATAVSALTGYRFTKEELEKFWQLDLNPPAEYGIRAATEGVGGYVNSAVYVVRRNFTIEPLVSFGINLVSEEADSAFSKGYMLVCSFGGNSDYSKDKNDGVLDLIKLDTKPSYYHCLTLCQDKDPDMLRAIVDNYYQVGKTNTYRIPKDHLPLLVKNGIFSNNAYVFAYKSELEHPPTLVSPWAVASVEKAKKRGITQWHDPKQEVNDIILEDILFKLGLLTIDTNEGCSKERLIVALDRANLL